MAIFKIEVSNLKEGRFEDTIEAPSQEDAEFTIKNMGYELHSIQVSRIMSLLARADRVLLSPLGMDRYSRAIRRAERRSK